VPFSEKNNKTDEKNGYHQREGTTKETDIQKLSLFGTILQMPVFVIFSQMVNKVNG